MLQWHLTRRGNPFRADSEGNCQAQTKFGPVNWIRGRNWAARATALAALFCCGCAGPFNQVTPCIVNCAVTLNGSPAVAPPSVAPGRVVVEPAPK